MRLAACVLVGFAGVAIAQPTAPPPPVNAVSTPIVRTDKTISGQFLKLPPGKAEVAAAAIEIPPGGATAIHQHPWTRIVYVERGPVRIINHDTGENRDFQSGEIIPEVVAQWHEGRATGPASARLIVIDLVPPGVNNTVMAPGKM
jgi:quercetin dioxygenase-like cupin family protein